jgi:L-aspartate oxidase
MKILETDFLIIGTGVAGLMAAHHLSGAGRILVATKRTAEVSNSAWAQGGISCVLDPGDSFDAHVADTLGAGAGLCHEAVVRAIVSGGPAAIAELERLGAHFARRDGDEGYDLGIEGGHTRRRVVHAGDVTGRHVIDCLLKSVRAAPGVDLLEQHQAIDLVTSGWLGLPGESRCLGAYFLDKTTGEIMAVRAAHTVLATGGAGKVYLYTSNPDSATGDGIAMAWRAGLAIHNLEMVQFHPTVLYHPKARTFLISEALRGEGGRLINASGQEFLAQVDPRASLAPRDIVARAIDYEMKRRGDACVYLDMTHRSSEYLERRFPTIHRTCLECGIDIARDPIPVVPAAHYCCGGVQADVDGRTEMRGLYAIGEVACTGLHGANRLASNSLLEGLVCAERLARRLRDQPAAPRPDAAEIPDWELGHAVPSDEAVVVEHNWNEVRTVMWDYVGIVRTNKRLDRALRRIRNLRQEIREYYLDYVVTADVLELRNITAVAELITRSALLRRESRGLHATLDYPQTGPKGYDTVVRDLPGGLI